VTIATDNVNLCATRPEQAIRWRENAILNRADARLRTIARAYNRTGLTMPRHWAAVVGEAYGLLADMGPLPAVTVTIRRDGAVCRVEIAEVV